MTCFNRGDVVVVDLGITASSTHSFDGGEETRVSLRGGYQQLLAALGIDGDEPLHARGQALRAFMPTLREGCEAALARAPGLLD